MAAGWRQMVAIMTGKTVGAIVIAAMAAHHHRLKEHLADRCISQTAQQLAPQALLPFDWAKPDMAGILIGMATGSVANKSTWQILAQIMGGAGVRFSR